ncbi:type IV pilus modification PilV family protein [Alishewanella tabrizica]|uniref:MSHA biogenesis protein MshD n=1 Tax=Alishewanella tabrizica TaxID=671278 RepID=A0ABQ2WBI6_9ALTE|nr:prepilin-type N-terminal cleavage/methylation domain-containing protein [Alishewanella tabrizica]GGW48598.1 MSHA biogenesis protein MshD [Alishewanella tabrizica]
MLAANKLSVRSRVPMVSFLRQRGVSLVELVVGITVLAIALSLITSILAPLFIKSTDPWHQVRATELGHSLMNEILARSYDENSDRSGGMLRCGETGAPPCTDAAQFGPDGSETRETYNDVDDFQGFVGSAAELTNLLGSSLADQYLNYQVAVNVTYAAPTQVTGINLAASQAKKIEITITTPTGANLQFAAYRGNW